jgi:hypothetical protein
MKTPAKDTEVMIYQKPLTREQPEGMAKISKVLYALDWTDSMGRPMWRCQVRFPKDSGVYERDISMITGE